MKQKPICSLLFLDINSIEVIGMRYYKTGNGIVATTGAINSAEITAKEYEAEMAVVKKRMDAYAKIYENSRPLTAEEVTAMLIRQQINTMTVDDNTALRMLEFYPDWAADTAYPAGYKVQYGGKLWRCLQAHTSQTGWEPENAPALWTEICETHNGTLADPIPYDGNMALESGKYYIQDYTIYLCTRDTGNPVYNPLAELVGIYVNNI